MGKWENQPMINEALESVQNLAETPLEDQPAIFEAAHDALRAALDSAANLDESTPSA